MKLRFLLLASAASVVASAAHEDGKTAYAGRKLGEAETLPDCKEFREDCAACAAAGYCVFSPDVGKDGSCLPNCDEAPAVGSCFSPPDFDDMTCKELSTDCKKDFDTCTGCLGSGFCAYSPDTGKDGSCLASCDDADGRCFEKGGGDDVCGKLDTEEPTPLPTIIEVDLVEPTPLPSPEPTHVAELTCLNTGGKIGTADCCLFVDDFPNTCTIGQCGCGRDFSHKVSVCECPKDSCYNGSHCVPISEVTPEPSPAPTTAVPTGTPTFVPSPFPTPEGEAECIESGGVIVTDSCCRDAGNFPNTCREGTCDCNGKESVATQLCICEEGKCFNGRRCKNIPTPDPTSVPTMQPTRKQAETCTRSGGEIIIESCCKSFDDFVDTCTYPEACDCSDKNSHDIAICSCTGEGQCYNGKKCQDTAEPTLFPTASPTAAPVVSTDSPTMTPVMIPSEPTFAPTSTDEPTSPPNTAFAGATASVGAAVVSVVTMFTLGISM